MNQQERYRKDIQIERTHIKNETERQQTTQVVKREREQAEIKEEKLCQQGCVLRERECVLVCLHSEVSAKSESKF